MCKVWPRIYRILIFGSHWNMTGQWKWPVSVCLSRLSDRRDLENGPSACPVSQKARKILLTRYKRCCHVFQILLKILCKQFTALCIAHPAWSCTPNSRLKNCCVLTHKNFISSVSFNALHYVCPTYYFHCLSAYPICWTLVGQANGPFSLCSVFLWPVCHVLKRQKNQPFPLSHLPVPDGTGRWAIFMVLSMCPICQTQTGQADCHFHCPICPVMF